MAKSKTPEIQDIIHDFATQLQAIVHRASIEKIMGALQSVGVSSKPGKRRGRPRGSKNVLRAAAPKAGGKRGRRSAEDLAGMSDALLAHVKANPGQRGEQIAKALRTDVTTMRRPMQALMAAKKVSTRGQKRGTQYFASNASRGAPKAKRAGRRGKGKRKAA